MGKILNFKNGLTICVECKYIDRKEYKKRIPIWYDLFCGHEKVQREQGIDFVTGEPGYVDHNDFGMVYITSEKSPYCREINTDGKCSLYLDIKESKINLHLMQNST